MEHTFNNIIDSVVCEVKSQGIFDEFRRECMADVDTKPAYQNLRQRVENSVSNFLNQQEWKPDLNKNQLREKLRKNIAESAFLDTGVERIVDQVVNPKINSIFLPKIEEIYYKFMGIEKPKPNEQQISMTVNAIVEQSNKMEIDENYNNNNNNNNNDAGVHSDLEAVSPDSNKSNPKCVSENHTDEKTDLNVINVQKNNYIKIGSNSNYENVEDDGDDNDHDEDDDFESPAFEPLEPLDIEMEQPKKIQDENSNDSKLSGISGLTSQDSLESESAVIEQVNTEQMIKNEVNDKENEESISNSLQASKENLPPLQEIQQQQQQQQQEIPQETPQQESQEVPTVKLQRNEPEDEQSLISLDVSTEINDVIDGGGVVVVGDVGDDGEHSQLSQVSSSSRLSIITDTQQSCDDKSTVDVNICEEAQMPKFDDDKDNDELNKNRTEPLVTTFTDITKTEIKFEGTERCKIIDNNNVFDSSYDDSSSYDVKPVNIDNYNQSSMISSDKSSDEHSKLFIDDSTMVNDESVSLPTNQISHNKNESAFSIKNESQSPTDNNTMKPIIKDTANLNLSDDKKPINQIKMEMDDNNKKIEQENIKQESYDMISQDTSILMGDEQHEQFDNGKSMDENENNDKVMEEKINVDDVESQKEQSKLQLTVKDNDHSLSSKSMSSSKSYSDKLKKDRHHQSAHRSRSDKSHSDSKKTSTSHREHSSKTQDTQKKSRSEHHSSKSSSHSSKSDDKSRSHHRSSTSSKTHSSSTSSSKSSRSSSSSNHHHRRSHHSERSNSKQDDTSDGVENKATVHDSKYNKDKSSHRPKHNEGSSNSKRRNHDESNSNGSGKDKSSESNGQKPKEKDDDDDHYSSREKVIERRRSNDRDSNDERDNGLPLSQSNGNNTNDKLTSSSVTINESSSQINTTKPSSSKSSTSSTSSTSLSSRSEFSSVIENINKKNHTIPLMHADYVIIENIPKETSTVSNSLSENKNFNESFVTAENVRDMTIKSTAERLNEQSLNDNDFIFLPTQPVVIDQILTGTDKNVELLIDQNRNRSDLIDHHNIHHPNEQMQKDELFYSTINKTLNYGVDDGIKKRIKPKFAENFHEAKKLMKIRKQIDREDQKRREKALVFAKQYIHKNKASSTSLMSNLNEQQGIEFEFACQTTATATATTTSSSSPIYGCEIVENVISIISNAPTDQNPTEAILNEVESKNSVQSHQTSPNENEKLNVEHVVEPIQINESLENEKSLQLQSEEKEKVELIENNTSDSLQSKEFVQNLESIVNETAESKPTLFDNLEAAPKTAHELEMLDHMQNTEDLLQILETSENSKPSPLANHLQNTESLLLEENSENKSEALQIAKPFENTESLQNDNGILLEIASTMSKIPVTLSITNNDNDESNMNMAAEPLEISAIPKEVEKEILENPLPTNDVREQTIQNCATETTNETVNSGIEQSETLLESDWKQPEIQDSGKEQQQQQQQVTIESVIINPQESDSELQQTLDSSIELNKIWGSSTEQQQKPLESVAETMESASEEEINLNSSGLSEIVDEIIISPVKVANELPNENDIVENLIEDELPFYGFPCDNFIFPYDEKSIADKIKSYENSLLKSNNAVKKDNKKELVVVLENTLNKKRSKLSKSTGKSRGKPIVKRTTPKSIVNRPIEEKPIVKPPPPPPPKSIEKSTDKPIKESINPPVDMPIDKQPIAKPKDKMDNKNAFNINNLNGFYKGSLQVNVYDIKYHGINMKRKLNDAADDNLNNVKVFKIDTTLNNNINSLDERKRKTPSTKSTKNLGTYSSSATTSTPSSSSSSASSLSSSSSTSSSTSSSSLSHSPSSIFNEFPYKENHFTCDSKKRRCTTRTEQTLNASPNDINTEESLSKNVTPQSTTPNRTIKTPSISVSQRMNQRYSTLDLYKPKRVTTSSRRRLINND